MSRLYVIPSNTKITNLLHTKKSLSVESMTTDKELIFDESELSVFIDEFSEENELVFRRNDVSTIVRHDAVLILK